MNALPTEERVKAMRDRDYLWCLVHLLLDKEEQLDQLCPQCKAQAGQQGCPACGRARESWGEGADNPTFDQEKFQRLKEGERE